MCFCIEELIKKERKNEYKEKGSASIFQGVPRAM